MGIYTNSGFGHDCCRCSDNKCKWKEVCTLHKNCNSWVSSGATKKDLFCMHLGESKLSSTKGNDISCMLLHNH